MSIDFKFPFMKDLVMTLAEELCIVASRRFPWIEPLSRLVVETSARAAGCWRLDNGTLNLIGFGWAGDMSLDVSQGFQDATRRVSLDQIGFGIVKAAITDKPAIGCRDSSATGLDGSASWIVRFGANTSLAVPIHDSQTHAVIGVLAVSTAAFVEEDDSLWQTLFCLSNELGKRNKSMV